MRIKRKKPDKKATEKLFKKAAAAIDAAATFPPDRTEEQNEALRNLENDPEVKQAFRFIVDKYRSDMNYKLENHSGTAH